MTMTDMTMTLTFTVSNLTLTSVPLTFSGLDSGCSSASELTRTLIRVNMSRTQLKFHQYDFR